MSKSDDALALIVGGAIGIAALAYLFRGRQTQQPVHQCPECKNQIQKGTVYCPYCYTSIRWV